MTRTTKHWQNTAELLTGWCAFDKVRLKDAIIRSLRGAVYSARLTSDPTENSKEHSWLKSQQTPTDNLLLQTNKSPLRHVAYDSLVSTFAILARQKITECKCAFSLGGTKRALCLQEVCCRDYGIVRKVRHKGKTDGELVCSVTRKA